MVIGKVRGERILDYLATICIFSIKLIFNICINTSLAGMHMQIRPRAKPFLDINVLHPCFPSLQMMASVKLARETCNNNTKSKSETKCPT